MQNHGVYIELLMSKEMEPDSSRYMSGNGPQLTIPINSHLTFEAQGPGGLRLDLMHNLADFSYYISIVIFQGEVILRYVMNINYFYQNNR